MFEQIFSPSCAGLNPAKRAIALRVAHGSGAAGDIRRAAHTYPLQDMDVRDYFFGSVALGSRAADVGRALLRVGAGLAIAFSHGIGKVPPSGRFIERVGDMGFPIPGLFAWMSGMAEFGAGLLLAIGLSSRPAALFVSLNMLVVFFIAHGGDPFGRRETPFLFLAIFVFFALAGGGRYSLDHYIRRKPRLTTRV